jgi:hypothetical protein
VRRRDRDTFVAAVPSSAAGLLLTVGIVVVVVAPAPDRPLVSRERREHRPAPAAGRADVPPPRGERLDDRIPGLRGFRRREAGRTGPQAGRGGRVGVRQQQRRGAPPQGRSEEDVRVRPIPGGGGGVPPGAILPIDVPPAVGGRDFGKYVHVDIRDGGSFDAVRRSAEIFDTAHELEFRKGSSDDQDTDTIPRRREGYAGAARSHAHIVRPDEVVEGQDLGQAARREGRNAQRDLDAGRSGVLDRHPAFLRRGVRGGEFGRGRWLRQKRERLERPRRRAVDPAQGGRRRRGHRCRLLLLLRVGGMRGRPGSPGVRGGGFGWGGRRRDDIFGGQPHRHGEGGHEDCWRLLERRGGGGWIQEERLMID